MKKLCWLVLCLFVCSMLACDEAEEEETAEQEEVEEEAAEEEEEVAEEEEDDFDLDALIAAQEERVKVSLCDRPFECFDEHDEFDEPEGFTREDCYEQQTNTARTREILADQDREVIEECAAAEEAMTGCLDEASCEVLLTFVQEVQPGDEVDACEEEWAAQNEACAFLYEAVAEAQEVAEE